MINVAFLRVKVFFFISGLNSPFACVQAKASIRNAQASFFSSTADVMICVFIFVDLLFVPPKLTFALIDGVNQPLPSWFHINTLSRQVT